MEYVDPIKDIENINAIKNFRKAIKERSITVCIWD